MPSSAPTSASPRLKSKTSSVVTTRARVVRVVPRVRVLVPYSVPTRESLRPRLRRLRILSAVITRARAVPEVPRARASVRFLVPTRGSPKLRLKSRTSSAATTRARVVPEVPRARALVLSLATKFGGRCL